MVRAVGNQGNWFARIEHASRYSEIDGKSFPCIFATHLKKTGYCDDGYEAGVAQWDSIVKALRDDHIAILTRHRVDDDGTWHRDGYMRVVRVKNVDTADGTLRLDVVQNICHLRN